MHATRPLPLGLIGALALVGLTESRLAQHSTRLATYSGLGARFAAHAATREARDCQVLAVGDSVMKFGFDPDAFRQPTGLRAYNLAVPGTPTPLGLSLARQALDAGARPAALVVGYMTFAGDPAVHVPDFAEAFSTADAWHLGRDTGQPALFGAVNAARWLPSLRYRHALRAATRAALDDRERRPAEDRAGPLLRTWARHAGAEPRPADGRFDGRMEPDLERRLFANPWRVEAAFEKAFRRLVALANARQIPVYWVVAPVTPEAQAKRDALGLDDRHTQNLRAILARAPGAIVLDARRSGYPASAFFDSCHLNAEGAARLSADIAAVIAARQQGKAQPANWKALPPFDANPAAELAHSKPSGHPRRQ